MFNTLLVEAIFNWIQESFASLWFLIIIIFLLLQSILSSKSEKNKTKLIDVTCSVCFMLSQSICFKHDWFTEIVDDFALILILWQLIENYSYYRSPNCQKTLMMVYSACRCYYIIMAIPIFIPIRVLPCKHRIGVLV